MSEDTDRGPLREVRRTLYGFGFSLFVIGAFALLFFYVIPTYFRSSGRDWKQEKSRTITLNYLHTDDSGGKDYGPLLQELTDFRVEAVDKLELDSGEVPDRIHVYLHRDLNSLKTAISTRRNSPEVDVPLATMDVIEGKPIKPVLVRLLTTFTWGRPSSEFLRLGLQTYFSNQYEEIHLRAAALEGTGFSLEEMVLLEESTDYLRSLQDRIYDSFDSPRAPAGLDMATASSLLRFEGAERPFRHELEVKAGSFVQYIIKEHGVESLKELWQRGSLEEGIEKAFGSSISETEESWRDYLSKKVEKSSIYRYFRARSLFEQGKPLEAQEALKGADEDPGFASETSYLQGKMGFLSGDWKKAKTSLERVSGGGTSRFDETEIRALEELIAPYEGGGFLKTGKLYLAFPEATRDLGELERTVVDIWERVENRLPTLDWSYGRFVVFLSPEGASGHWEKVELPGWVLVTSDREDLRYRLAELLVGGANRIPTYSNLLRQGLIHYLSGEQVFRQASDLLDEGRWSPLDGLTFSEEEISDSDWEAAAFVGFLIEKLGSERFLEIWEFTTPVGGDRSLEGALKEVLGRGLTEVERELKQYLQECRR